MKADNGIIVDEDNLAMLQRMTGTVTSTEAKEFWKARMEKERAENEEKLKAKHEESLKAVAPIRDVVHYSDQYVTGVFDPDTELLPQPLWIEGFDSDTACSPRSPSRDNRSAMSLSSLP